MGKGEVLGFLHWMEKVGFLLLHGMFWDFRTSLGNYLLGVSTASNVWGILFFFVSEKACVGIFSGHWNNSSFTPPVFSNPTVACLFLLPWNFWYSNFVFNRTNKQKKPTKNQTPKQTNKQNKTPIALICSMISVLNQWWPYRVSKGMASPGKDTKTQPATYQHLCSRERLSTFC